MAKTDRIVIVGAARTPLGSFQGKLKGFSAPALGAIAIEAALKRADLDDATPDEVVMGCVLPAGLAHAPARPAASLRGVPASVGDTTVTKVSGAAMQAA